MNIIENEINENLRDVIERNFDAHKGYMKAAEHVRSPELANAFRVQALQRKKFALDLETEANVFGSDIREKIKNGTFQGSLHRTWMDLKTALSLNHDEAMLEECIRGENDALKQYNELVNDKSFVGVPHSMILEQRETIKSCLNDLELLETIAS